MEISEAEQVDMLTPEHRLLNLTYPLLTTSSVNTLNKNTDAHSPHFHMHPFFHVSDLRMKGAHRAA